MFAELDPTMMIISVAAVLAGAVCGDHISPISDTTIMSSSGAQSNHINHVQTQMQYAFVVIAVCCWLPDRRLYRKLVADPALLAGDFDRSAVGDKEEGNVRPINHTDVASSKRTCFAHYMGH